MGKANTIHIIDLDDWAIVYNADGDLIWADHPAGSGSDMASMYEGMGMTVAQLWPEDDLREFFVNNCHNPGNTFDEMIANAVAEGCSPPVFEE